MVLVLEVMGFAGAVRVQHVACYAGIVLMKMHVPMALALFFVAARGFFLFAFVFA
jgi:hypothetical protein